VVRDGGIGCVMASYNLINGVKSTQNRHLLRDVLKGPVEQGGMGFEGFVISDWWAMPGAQVWQDDTTAHAVALEAVDAGLDVELPWTMHYYDSTLADADPALVEDAARRVLTQKYRFQTALGTDAWSVKPPTSRLTDSSITPNETHEALAEEAAIKSAVLLSNGLDGSPVLPLRDVAHVAVIGPAQNFSLVSSSIPKGCFTNPEPVQGATPSL